MLKFFYEEEYVPIQPVKSKWLTAITIIGWIALISAVIYFQFHPIE